jgi:hypothetical protein
MPTPEISIVNLRDRETAVVQGKGFRERSDSLKKGRRMECSKDCVLQSNFHMTVILKQVHAHLNGERVRRVVPM